MSTPRPSWPRYFMGFAEQAKIMSKDETQVGAVLVGPDGEIRLSAYNGPPRGVVDSPDRFERPRKYLFASHAEQNLIAFAARVGIRTDDCTVYVTHPPCSACAKSLIQAGIARVVYGQGTTQMQTDNQLDIAAASEMFEEAGVVAEFLGTE